jgi:uncharacterized membrane protein YphA (DoxX/SURF4 family)
MTFFRKYGLLAACILLALPLIAFGGAKLAGVPQVHESFKVLGLPGWFGYFIGACEVAGGVGLFIKPLRSLAALGLCVILVGALYFHVTHPPLGAGVPALIYLLLASWIATRGRASLVATAS